MKRYGATDRQPPPTCHQPRQPPPSIWTDGKNGRRMLYDGIRWYTMYPSLGGGTPGGTPGIQILKRVDVTVNLSNMTNQKYEKRRSIQLFPTARPTTPADSAVDMDRR
jgi:hypothetical protein